MIGTIKCILPLVVCLPFVFCSELSGVVEHGNSFVGIVNKEHDGFTTVVLHGSRKNHVIVALLQQPANCSNRIATATPVSEIKIMDMELKKNQSYQGFAEKDLDPAVKAGDSLVLSDSHGEIGCADLINSSLDDLRGKLSDDQLKKLNLKRNPNFKTMKQTKSSSILV